MIFMMGVANNTHTNNTIQNNAAMQQNLVDQWGLIPGSLGYEFNRNVTIYSFAQAPVAFQTVQLSKSAPHNFQIDRTFGSPQWQSTKSVIEYQESLTYT